MIKENTQGTARTQGNNQRQFNRYNGQSNGNNVSNYSNGNNVSNYSNMSNYGQSNGNNVSNYSNMRNYGNQHQYKPPFQNSAFNQNVQNRVPSIMTDSRPFRTPFRSANRDFRCYTCGVTGHSFRNCPTTVQFNNASYPKANRPQYNGNQMGRQDVRCANSYGGNRQYYPGSGQSYSSRGSFRGHRLN